jgi:hypothetical protein
LKQEQLKQEQLRQKKKNFNYFLPKTEIIDERSVFSNIYLGISAILTILCSFYCLIFGILSFFAPFYLDLSFLFTFFFGILSLFMSIFAFLSCFPFPIFELKLRIVFCSIFHTFSISFLILILVYVYFVREFFDNCYNFMDLWIVIFSLYCVPFLCSNYYLFILIFSYNFYEKKKDIEYL